MLSERGLSSREDGRKPSAIHRVPFGVHVSFGMSLSARSRDTFCFSRCRPLTGTRRMLSLPHTSCGAILYRALRGAAASDCPAESKTQGGSTSVAMTFFRDLRWMRRLFPPRPLRWKVLGCRRACIVRLRFSANRRARQHHPYKRGRCISRIAAPFLEGAFRTGRRLRKSLWERLLSSLPV